MTANKNKPISLRILFLLGAFLGAVAFVCVYGVRILDFTNTGWLFYGDNDLRQHYIAWCNFRKDPWSFPIGLVDSLSYPNSMSVIYTDSIPIFAVFFKLFRNVLPVTFQYFGLFGIISFMLMGGLSAVLLTRFCDDYAVCLLGSVFYIMSFQVLQRMYYHTALAAQWIIILAMIIWVYDAKIKSVKSKIALWCLMGFLCVGIHSYYLAMVGIVLMGLVVTQFFTTESDRIWDKIKIPAVEIASFCVVGLIQLYVLGGFYGGTSSSGAGLGSFGANLNTFINPINYGRLLPRLPLFFDFQYEGFGYLGAGIIYIYIIIAAGMIFRLVRKVPEEAFHTKKVYGIVAALVVVASVMMSTLPLISFNDKKIVWIPYPQIVEKVLGIFRSNGRIIWVAVYVLITAAISFTAYTFRQNRIIIYIILSAALFIQLGDESAMIKERQDYYGVDYQVKTLWDAPEIMYLTDGKDEFIFLYNDNDITLLTAYYGYLHGMRQNNYYFARDIDDKINSEIEKYRSELSEGIIRENAVYVVNDTTFFENQPMYEKLMQEMRYAYADGHLILTK